MPALKALKVKAVFANQAESSWVFFAGFPPCLILLLLPLWSRSSRLLVACWNMP